MGLLRFLLVSFLLLMHFPFTAMGFNFYQIVGGLLAFGTLSITFMKKQVRLPSPKLLVPVLMLAFAGVIGSLAIDEISYSMLFKMAQNLILLVVVSIVLKRPSDLKLIFGGIALGGGITVTAGLLEVAEGAEGRISSILNNANGYGQIAVFTSLCLWGVALSVRSRIVRLICFGLSVPCLMGLGYSGSRGAVMGLAAALALLIAARPTRFLAIGLTLIVTVALGGAMKGDLGRRFQEAFEASRPERISAFQSRMDLAGRGIAVYFSYPVFGVGFGNAREGMDTIGVESLKVTHNAITQLLAETGTVGSVGFLWLLAVTAWAFWQAGVRRWEDSKAMIVMAALMMAIVVSQLSSGNYFHAIWYVLFGVGQSRAMEAKRPLGELQRTCQADHVPSRIGRVRRY